MPCGYISIIILVWVWIYMSSQCSFAHTYRQRVQPNEKLCASSSPTSVIRIYVFITVAHSNYLLLSPTPTPRTSCSLYTFTKRCLSERIDEEDEQQTDKDVDIFGPVCWSPSSLVFGSLRFEISRSLRLNYIFSLPILVAQKAHNDNGCGVWCYLSLWQINYFRSLFASMPCFVPVWKLKVYTDSVLVVRETNWPIELSADGL